MDALFHIDWQDLVIPTHSVAEMILRGTAMYIGLFLILRFVMNRQTGSIGIADILVIVIIADAAQNGFAREYQSLTEGIVLVLTIVFWDFVIDWAGYRFPAFGRLVHPPPLPLVKDGKVVRRNLRQEYITMDELETHLRKQGIDDLSKVKFACMEGDGEISVIEKDKDPGKMLRPRRKRRDKA